MYIRFAAATLNKYILTEFDDKPLGYSMWYMFAIVVNVILGLTFSVSTYLVLGKEPC